VREGTGRLGVWLGQFVGSVHAIGPPRYAPHELWIGPILPGWLIAVGAAGIAIMAVIGPFAEDLLV
jgi:hypothetical protein